MAEEFKLLSEYYNIDGDLFVQNGIFNPTITKDTKLFIDPLLLRNSDENEFNTDAVTQYREYFQGLYNKILLLGNDSLTQTKKDKIFQNLIKEIKSTEKKGLCLGFAGANNRGRGIGPIIAGRILKNAKDIILAGVDNPIIFHSLFLLEEGIGPDFISDMTAKIIEKSLFAYTQRISELLKIPTRIWYIEGDPYRLPKHPKEEAYINFVPLDVLSKIPVDNDFDFVMERFININPTNDEIRDRVNNQIAEIFSSMTDQNKGEVKKRVKEELIQNNLMLDLSEMISNIEPVGYDKNLDPLGVTLIPQFINFIKTHFNLQFEGKKPPEEIVFEIVKRFENYILNNNDAKRENLYYQGEPRAEKCWQQFFAAYVREIFAANNLDFTPEFETGRGPVDFKVSRGTECKILIEMKLSSNGQYQHGLSRQLEIYKDATENITDSYYIFIDLETNPKKSREKVDKLNKILATNETDIKTNLIIIDGKIKPSASKT